MFIDRARIFVKAGDGGEGAVSFHREKYVPRGGPDGGDGGRGGDIVLIADASLRTLLDFKYQKHHRAPNGASGKGSNMHGKNGEDLIIRVPPGTLVRDTESGKLLADMYADGDKRILLRGGMGGKGNARFSSSTRQAPRFAQTGQKTDGRWLNLELKTIADVGLIGFPNVGKSTILSVLTAARPKIADYHFTTLSPNLGVATWKEAQFVLADIPGLIEGASSGAGLGHDFLRHIERTRMLIHVVDASGIEGRDPLDDYLKINEELRTFSEELAGRPQIIAANKMDLPEAESKLEDLKKGLPGHRIFPVSAASRTGFDALLDCCVEMLSTLPPPARFTEEISTEDLDKPAQKEFTVRRKGENFVVEGSMVESILERIFPQDPSSMAYFQKLLQSSGINRELKRQGIKNGDTVIMGEMTFEYID
jgi:GTPase